MNTVSPGSVVVLEPGVDHTHLEDQVILLEPREGRYLSLDAVGSRVWELLQDDPRVDRAISTLLDEYDVEEERLRADVDRFLRRCEELRLLRIEPGDSSPGAAAGS